MNNTIADVPLIEYFEYIEKLQEEAKRRFVSQIRVRDNSFKCVILKDPRNYIDDYEYTIKYSINDIERTLQHTDVKNVSKEQLVSDLMKVLSEDIAKNILAGVDKEVFARI